MFRLLTSSVQGHQAAHANHDYNSPPTYSDTFSVGQADSSTQGLHCVYQSELMNQGALCGH